MLNKAPIFVNGFQRGGTNILVNLLVSHPDVCRIRETHRVFRGPARAGPAARLVYWGFYLPIVLAARHDVFGAHWIGERSRLPRVIGKYVDLLLYWEKAVAASRLYEQESDGVKESTGSRLLCKNVNGLVLATGIFKDIYADATFVGLVRNGLALCEGFIRRGWTAERFAAMYARVCQRMIEDAGRMENYHVVRFEDLIAAPARTIAEIYGLVGLDFDHHRAFRLQSKQSMDRDGERRYTFGAGTNRKVHWFLLDELQNYFRADVNENQIQRLSPRDVDIVLAHARGQMEHFGYC